MTDLHPVKEETFHPIDGTNVDPKGYRRLVDVFKTTDFGLYMARKATHPKFGYLESWLLPALGIRANIFHFRDGVEVSQDFYFDVVDITNEDGVWKTRDLYVDLVSTTGQPIEVLDIDELSAATSAGYISAEDAEHAIETTLAAVEGITRHGDDAMKWLATRGVALEWADPDSLDFAEVGV
ncbi:DUF402 domain-containing protein [Corynebacterium choanae]|nr:DUF402 domain-containing protein [Corynebacterium choanae]